MTPANEPSIKKLLGGLLDDLLAAAEQQEGDGDVVGAQQLYARAEQTALQENLAGHLATIRERQRLLRRRALLTQGQQALIAGELATARPLFEEVVQEVAPGDPEAAHGLIAIDLALAQQAEAAQTIYEARDYYGRVLSLARDHEAARAGEQRMLAAIRDQETRARRRRIVLIGGVALAAMLCVLAGWLWWQAGARIGGARATPTGLAVVVPTAPANASPAAAWSATPFEPPTAVVPTAAPTVPAPTPASPLTAPAAATLTPTTFPSRQPTSSPTLTPIPSPTPAAIALPAPSDMNTPQPPSTSAPIPSPRPTATSSWTPVPALPQISLVQPEWGFTGQDPVRFIWEASGSLREKAYFEIVIWSVGEAPSKAQGVAAPVRARQLDVNLSVVPHVRDAPNRDFYWTVIVVRLDPELSPSYKRLTEPMTGLLISIPKRDDGAPCPPGGC